MALKLKYKWERHFARQMGRSTQLSAPRAVEKVRAREKELKRVFVDSERVVGLERIAFALGMNRVNLWRAYRSDPEFRRYIYQADNGRYWALTGELMNLWTNVANRREGGEARRRPRKPVR